MGYNAINILKDTVLWRFYYRNGIEDCIFLKINLYKRILHL